MATGLWIFEWSVYKQRQHMCSEILIRARTSEEDTEKGGRERKGEREGEGGRERGSGREGGSKVTLQRSARHVIVWEWSTIIYQNFLAAGLQHELFDSGGSVECQASFKGIIITRWCCFE
jgi:hypothetical protein